MEWLVLAALAAGGLGAPAPDAQAVTADATPQRDEPALDEEAGDGRDVLVVGQRSAGLRADTVQIGAFRNRALLDTPATVAVMTRALLDAQGAQGLEDALRNTAGVGQQSTSPITTNSFVSRGVFINPRTNYRLNGALQIVNMGPIPIENKQRVEMLKGVSALYYGLSTPSGIVNVVTKRAGDRPVTQVQLTGDAEGSYGGGVDIGRRFGTVGVRLNGYAGHLEFPIDCVDGRRAMASGAFDWQATARLSLKLDLEYYRRATDEPGGIRLPDAVGAVRGIGGTIALPDIPDPHRQLAPRDAPYVTWVNNVLARGDYDLGGGWGIRVEGGRAQARRDRAQSNLERIDLATGEGVLVSVQTRDQDYRNTYVRTEVSGALGTFGIRHELLFGYTRNRQVQTDQTRQSFRNVAQNLYAPRSIAFDTLVPSSVRIGAGSVNVDSGLYLMDTAHLGERWLAIAGVRHVDYATEAGAQDFTIRTWTPTAALVFRPTARSSVYATYIEGLESAGTAPDGTANAGDVLAPVRSRQYELGTRIEIAGAIASLAGFVIDRGLDYADARNVQVVDGRALHRGVEASLQGQLRPGLSLLLSGQYLDAVQRRTGNAAQNGKQVENTPHWAGSAFVEYRPARLPDLSLSAGAYHSGRRWSDPQNRALLPAYTIYSLGASYGWTLAGGARMTARVNADNLLDARYWATGGTTLYAGLGRTVRASLTLDY
ncbi:iron complex outermembrane receptor protein [Sphingomonas sp. BE138]|uniref:TonB-dependent siderophore receptor n=1 Tax=Sphingomonas sp. BE138 TaxID=2817845 RepID=UPI002857587F|nr:TonB-dependent siderophore receptor [Sphingomonas sp. BE138]MDR6788511.1 iron complex outermembrane receptor protein [Sphingomonas sp. BE138]